METLPGEILAYTLYFAVDHPGAILNIARVCKKWWQLTMNSIDIWREIIVKYSFDHMETFGLQMMLPPTINLARPTVEDFRHLLANGHIPQRPREIIIVKYSDTNWLNLSDIELLCVEIEKHKLSSLAMKIYRNTYLCFNKVPYGSYRLYNIDVCITDLKYAAYMVISILYDMDRDKTRMMTSRKIGHFIKNDDKSKLYILVHYSNIYVRYNNMVEHIVLESKNDFYIGLDAMNDNLTIKVY